MHNSFKAATPSLYIDLTRFCFFSVSRAPGPRPPQFRTTGGTVDHARGRLSGHWRRQELGQKHGILLVGQPFGIGNDLGMQCCYHCFVQVGFLQTAT